MSILISSDFLQMHKLPSCYGFTGLAMFANVGIRYATCSPWASYRAAQPLHRESLPEAAIDEACDSFGRWLSRSAPVVPFYPFSFWVPLLKPNSRKKGNLIIKGLLENLVIEPLPPSGFTTSHQTAKLLLSREPKPVLTLYGIVRTVRT